nr:hypothetical protein Iba_chr12dCG10680 [Ipomoea batatas]
MIQGKGKLEEICIEIPKYPSFRKKSHPRENVKWQ